jgi:methylglyoxal synthase
MGGSELNMNIALIAHNQKKPIIINFALAYKHVLEKHNLFATGTTGQLISEETGLSIHRFQSGPLGGDQQIGAMIANNEMDMVIFFRDPLTAQPHEPDVSALIRLCDVHQIPLATNISSAEIFIHGLDRGDMDWRKVLKERRDREV